MEVIMQLLTHRRARHQPDQDVEPRRRPAAPAPVLEPAVRRRRARRRVADRAAPRRQARHRPAVDRRHPVGGLRRARPALGRDGGAGARRSAPSPTGPSGGSSGMMHIAETREQALPRRRVRHAASGSTTSSTRRRSRRWTSASAERGARGDRVRQRVGPRVDRHRRRRLRADRTAAEAVGWVRVLHDARPRVGQPAGDACAATS